MRGGGSSLYGSGALGGVIGIETMDARDLLRPGETRGGRVRTAWSSNGGVLTNSLAGYAAEGIFDGVGFISYRSQGNDLKDGDGDAILNSETDVLNGMAKFGVDAGRGLRLSVTGMYYADEGVTPPNANAAATDTNVVDRDGRVGSVRARVDYTPEGSDFWDLTATVYFDDVRVEEDRRSDGRFDRSEYRTFGFEAVNRTRLDLGLPVGLVYGVEAYRDTQTGLRDGAARPEFPDAGVDFAAAFAEARIELTDTLEVTPGLRVDRFALDPDGGDGRTETAVSPRVGVSWRPTPGWQLFGSVGQAFRAPSLTELYTDGTHFAIQGFSLGPGAVFSGVNRFIPNPDLKPEKALQYEIGARFDRGDVLRRGDRLSFSTNAYYADVTDYVDQVVSFIDFSTDRFVPGVGFVVDGSTRTSNVDAELWGFEAEARYDAGGWFAGLTGAIPRGRRKDGGALGSIPQDRLVLTGGLRPTQGAEFGLRATLARGQDDVPAEGEPTPGYVTLDAFASYTVERGALAGATFRAGVDNILDSTHRIHPNGLNQPGRTFKISAVVPF
ncbi:MAG: TonB-dependent receptor domain-containing protein [Rubrimonas sp.]